MSLGFYFQIILSKEAVGNRPQIEGQKWLAVYSQAEELHVPTWYCGLNFRDQEWWLFVFVF